MISDQEILITIKKNKEKGIHCLFDRYYKPLVLFADEFVKDMAVSEDLVQEFFIRICEDKYLTNVVPSALSSYLFSSVRNSCIKYLLKKDVLRHRVELTGYDIPVDNFGYIDETENERVLKEMEVLPEQTRRVIEGVVIKGLKYKEVAQELNVSVNTVKTLLSRGIKKLQSGLSACKKQICFIFLKKSF